MDRAENAKLLMFRGHLFIRPQLTPFGAKVQHNFMSTSRRTKSQIPETRINIAMQDKQGEGSPTGEVQAHSLGHCPSCPHAW